MDYKGINIREILNDNAEQSLLFIHGNGLDEHSWDYVIPFLRRNFNLYILDLTSYNFIDIKINEDSWSAWCSDLVFLIHEKIKEPIHIVGHSLGANMAITVACKMNPKIILSLVLLSYPPFYTKQADSEINKRIELIRRYGMAELGRSMAENIFYPVTEEKTELVVQSFKKHDIETYMCKITTALELSQFESLKDIKQPVLLVCGARDALFPVELTKVSSSFLKNSEYYILSDAGNMVQVDQPEEVAKHISYFINSRVTMWRNTNSVETMAHIQYKKALADYIDIETPKMLHPDWFSHKRKKQKTDLIHILDSRGMTLYISPSLSKIYGHEFGFLENKSILNFVYYKDLFVVQRALDNAIKHNKKEQKIQYRRIHRLRKIVWLESEITPLLDLNGNISRVIFETNDITEQKEQEDKLKKLAITDILTQLPNRRFFEECLEKAMHDTKRLKKLMAVFILDCDGFKQINDSYGHDVGDKVLQTLAGRLISSIRSEDVVCRIGGDEFQVLLTNIKTESEAYLVAERILENAFEYIQVNEHNFNLSVSIGVSFYRGEDKTKDLLLKEADLALYEVKRKGKNGYNSFSQQKIHLLN